MSAFLIGSHTNALAFDKAIETGRIVISHYINLELSDVFLRSKFDRFASLQDRINLLGYLDRQLFLWPNSLETIKACRDPKDDKYLDLAVTCKASCIVTGDKDLLVLHPFKNIPILTAAEFLNTFNSSLILNELQAIYASKG